MSHQLVGVIERADERLDRRLDPLRLGSASLHGGGDDRQRVVRALPFETRLRAGSTVYETPGTSVDESPLPWLLRRLDAALHDASVTGRAAREAMGELARPVA